MATPIPENEAPLRAPDVAAVTGGRWIFRHPGPARLARGVTTDSRAVRPGGAFVALRGARQDGHAFLGDAIAAGASLLVVERGRAPADPGRADVVEVDDTLAAWGAVARAHLRGWRSANPGARTVGITGSAGKTTTKELTAALLGAPSSCLATTGNLNNRIGLPAVALQAGPAHRYLVLEMGMNAPGEIAELSAVAEPDVGVITNVGLAHAGGVGGLAGVAREKGALFAGLDAGGVAVANADDPAVLAQLARAPSARAVTFGTGSGTATPDYLMETREPTGIEGSRLTIRRAGGRAAVQLPLPGAAAAIDFVAALAAAEAAVGQALDDAQIASALDRLRPIAGRMNVVRLAGDVLVLDDTYNASPATVRAGLATLAELGQGRRVAVVGEMKELGDTAADEHEALGEAVAAAGVALLVSCGGLAERIAGSAARRGVEVVLAGDVEAAARLTLERVRPGDAVLVKASRSVAAERVVEALVRALGPAVTDGGSGVG